jgi:group II intron reverse transcriptase/maturase
MTTATRYFEYYGLQETFDRLYKESKEGKRFYNLMDIITSRENILLAFRMIKSNTGSRTRGTDDLTIDDYKVLNEEEFIQRIRARLKNFVPHSVRRVYIPKPNGKSRPLGIPTMEDRLIQQAIKQVMEPICEAKFFKNSYGFRPNRTAHHAKARVLKLINLSKLHYVVDIDIKGFFDNVNHKKLLQQIYTLGIRDKQLLQIIKKMLRAEIKGEGIPNKGTPQGGVLSPLLSNIVLNELDQWVSGQWETFQTKHKYSFRNQHRALRTSNLKEGYIVRYADDFKILTTDYKTAQKWYHAVRLFLKDRLKLDISPEKSKITNLRKNATEFLGFQIRAIKKGKARVAISNILPKKQRAIIKQLKTQIIKVQKSPSGAEAFRLNSIIRGLHNYFEIATHVYLDFHEIAFKVSRTMYNRFKDIAEISYRKAKGYERYNRKSFTIGNVTIIPIVGISHKPPMNFNQEICNYTRIGRELKQKKDLRYRLQRAVSILNQKFIADRTVEYNDNRISRFIASNGKCEVTGIDLTEQLDFYHCHHRIPTTLGGSDSYDNLCVLHKFVHILVHATTTETIDKYMEILNLNKKGLGKLNKLRRSCKLEPISI